MKAIASAHRRQLNASCVSQFVKLFHVLVNAELCIAKPTEDGDATYGIPATVNDDLHEGMLPNLYEEPMPGADGSDMSAFYDLAGESVGVFAIQFI